MVFFPEKCTGFLSFISAAQVNLIQEQESERLQMKLRDEEAQRLELSRQLETSR